MMKMEILITHDIVHVTVSRKSLLNLAQFRQDPNLISLAIRGFKNDEAIKRILQYELHNDVLSTWFIMPKWISKIKPSIKQVLDGGCEIAMHPVTDSDLSLKSKFEHKLGEPIKGFRKHFLRVTKDTFKIASKQGYLYDSSLYGATYPFQVDGIIEIPLTFQDFYLIHCNRLKNVLNYVLNTLKSNLETENIISFLFHQDALMRRREWTLFKSVVQFGVQHSIPFPLTGDIAERFGSLWL
jgi:hypothetical protein